MIPRAIPSLVYNIVCVIPFEKISKAIKLKLNVHVCKKKFLKHFSHSTILTFTHLLYSWPAINDNQVINVTIPTSKVKVIHGQRTLDWEILSQTMDLELIRTLAFYQKKHLVIADSQTYRARYLGLSPSVCFSPGQKISKHNLFQMFKDGRYSPPQRPILTGNGI
jgi:hypothetical protein